MRQSVFMLVLLCVAANAHAQLGPTTSRVVSRHMPSKAPSNLNFNAEALLQVSARGRVDSVEIISSSGDEAFDKQWRKFLSDWRFVPAVDEAGQPIETVTRIFYKPSGLTAQPQGAPAATSLVSNNVIGDSERLDRMTCKDFLWEYQLVTDAVPRRLALLDPLLKTPLIMLASEARPSDAQMATVRERYDQVVSRAADHCEDNPTDVFWKGVMKPALEAVLAGG